MGLCFEQPGLLEEPNMIPCPQCDRHVPEPEDGSTFECPFCKEATEPDAGGWSRSTKIAIGVGIAVAATIGAVKLFGNTVEPKFQPAYGAAIDEPVEF
jgi:endogenous inhibitor of DNA gyrase (YacG/DUF329 family)